MGETIPKNCRISVAMATYNGAKYIEEQLNSIISQSYLPDELIICDDCSKDNTVDIIRSFESRCQFNLKFVKNSRNLGYSANFNKALMMTSGDIIFLCDQDDVWFYDKIEYIVDVFMNNNDTLVVTNDALITDENLNGHGITSLGQIKSAGLGVDNYIIGCCAAVKKEWLQVCLPIPPKYPFGHDDWIVGISHLVNRRKIVPKVLQYYRRHTNNTSKSIVNSTKKLSSSRAFMIKLKDQIVHIFGRETDSHKQSTYSHISAYSIIAEWAKHASLQTNSSLANDLIYLSRKLSVKAELLNKRIRIRNKPIIIRIYHVCMIKMTDKYSKYYRLHNALRDAFLG